MKEEYFYKQNITAGAVYMQIWKRNPKGKDEYIMSLGNATTCRERLVLLAKLQEQTKVFDDLKTKLFEEEKEKKDQV